MKQNRSLSPIVPVSIIGVIVVAAVALTVARSVAPVAPAAPDEPAVRTVIAQTTGTPEISQPSSPLQTFVIEGTVPATPALGTVLTDENCTPDPQGVSHCINQVRMDDGSMLKLVHPHRMSDVPCLAPQERIKVQAA